MEECIRDVALKRGDAIDASLLVPTDERIWTAVFWEEEIDAKRKQANLGNSNCRLFKAVAP
jgi:hypothetical protein